MTTDKIKSLLAECEKLARIEGFEGEDFQPTSADLVWVCDELGRKPTAEEWKAAGLAWVGSNHIAEPEEHEAPYTIEVGDDSRPVEWRPLGESYGSLRAAARVLADEDDPALYGKPKRVRDASGAIVDADELVAEERAR